MSHYDTLGVAKSATPEEIKRAYRKLASQHHPDKGGDTKKFQEVEEAYRVLSDPNQRQQYDNPQPQGFHFNSGGFDGFPPGMEDILSRFNFGPGHPFGRHQQPRRNKDLRVEIAVSLFDTLQDQRKTLSIQTTNGHRENIEITVPRGVGHGTQIKYPGLGDTFFNTLPRGDLYVVVHLQPHDRYQVQGLDLVAGLDMNCFEAILGSSVEITTIDNRTLSLQIPAGSQTGTVLRVRDEGLYQMHSNARGNILIRINVTVPQNLTESQKDLVRQIQVGL
jgi:curved DNA-binding protein